MTRALGLTGKMAPVNSLITRLWSRAKPSDDRFREAPMTATLRGEKMGSRDSNGWSIGWSVMRGILSPKRPASVPAGTEAGRFKMDYLYLKPSGRRHQHPEPLGCQTDGHR
jgi:hypothetical protein